MTDVLAHLAYERGKERPKSSQGRRVGRNGLNLPGSTRAAGTFGGKNLRNLPGSTRGKKPPKCSQGRRVPQYLRWEGTAKSSQGRRVGRNGPNLPRVDACRRILRWEETVEMFPGGRSGRNAPGARAARAGQFVTQKSEEVLECHPANQIPRTCREP